MSDAPRQGPPLLGLASSATAAPLAQHSEGSNDAACLSYQREHAVHPGQPSMYAPCQMRHDKLFTALHSLQAQESCTSLTTIQDSASFKDTAVWCCKLALVQHTGQPSRYEPCHMCHNRLHPHQPLQAQTCCTSLNMIQHSKSRVANLFVCCVIASPCKLKMAALS